jgi:hypothetical protein
MALRHDRPPGMRRAERHAREAPREPPGDLASVVTDLGPHVGAAARAFLVAVRDARLLRGVSAEDLVGYLALCEQDLARRFPRPSNASR